MSIGEDDSGVQPGNRYFLAYWCNEGFEALEDITKYQHWEQQQLMDILSEKSPQKNPMNSMISHMKMRMRFNPQREYELYAFMTTPSVDREDLVEWSDRDPQSLVDWIRKNGIKVASDKDHMLATRIKIS